MSRRTFVGGVVAAAGVVAGADLLLPTTALAHGPSSAPRPIPGGFTLGGVQFHTFFPGMGAENATITDFVGKVGFAQVQGRGTGHNRKTNQKQPLLFDSDMRFMKGRYVGKDGRMHRGTFAFV